MTASSGTRMRRQNRRIMVSRLRKLDGQHGHGSAKFFTERNCSFECKKIMMDSSVYRRTSASWRRFPDRYPLSCRPAPVSYIQLSSFLFPLVLFDFDALKHCAVIARKYRDVEKKYQICRWRGKKETRDWTKCHRKRDRNLRRR